MSYAAEPYAQFVDDLVTSLTGGIVREEFQFLPELEPFKLSAPAPVIPSTVRVYGQAGGAFRRFQQRTDYQVSSDFAIQWQQTNGKPAPGAVLPDEGAYFFVNYEAPQPAGAAPLLTDRNPGSVTRLLAESFAREYAVLSKQLEAIYKAGFVDTAGGRDLDQIAALVGVERRLATFATGSILFSRGTPAEADIFIPAGFRVSTAKPPVAAFETTAPVTLRRGSLSVEAPIQALAAGSDGVVPAQTIQVFNRPILGIEAADNPQGTQFSTSTESDEQLRSRIRRALETAGQATTGAMLGALTSIAGLREKDVQVLEDPISHPGLIQINVALPEMTDEERQKIFDRAVELIEATRPVGVRVVHNIDAPRPAGANNPGPGVEPPADPAPAVFGGAGQGQLFLNVDFIVTLTPTLRSLPEADRAALETSGVNTVDSFIADAGFGDPLIYNELVARLMALPGVLDVALEMFPQNAPSGPRRKNLIPVSSSVRPVAGNIDVRVGASIVVLDLFITVTRQSVGAQTPVETVASLATSEITDKLNNAFRLAIPPTISTDVLSNLAGGSEQYRIKTLRYNLEFLDAGVRLLQQNAVVNLGAGDQIWVRQIQVTAE